MSKTKIKSIAFLILIFLVGLFLRVYRLNQNVPPLYADETSQYLLLQSILNGSSGIFTWIVNVFFSCTWFLGLSTLGVRLTSAIYGSLGVLTMYFFGLRMSGGSKKVTLLASIIIALIPWSFMISRIGHTHIPIIVLLTMMHVTLYLKSKTFKEVTISLLPLILATSYYPSFVVLAPFGLVLPLIDSGKFLYQKNKALLITLILLAGAACVIASVRFNIFNSGSRAMDLAIWRDVNTTYEINKFRALSWNSSPSLFSFGLPPEQLANKLVYNRAMANLSIFAKNYFSFFTPDWLFFKGDAILRHSTGQVGAFYPFLIPFMLYGAFVFFGTADKKARNTVLIWILASPIPAAITKDGAGYLLRVVTMLPFLTYFCALGMVQSFNLIKKNWRIPYGIVVFLIALYSAYYFFYGYFHVYPSLSARSYEYGFKELSDFQVANGNTPMLVIWDGYYHNYDFRFWQKTPFDQFKSYKLKEIVVGQSHFKQTFSNLYFVNPKSLSDLQSFLKENTIDFVVLPDRYFVNYPVEIDKFFATPSAVFDYPDKTPALKVFSLDKVTL